jgi:hypothetical protein
MGIEAMQLSQSILYFEQEGRQNLPQVLRVLKRVFKKRPDLQACKIVVFTAIGEGPALAYNFLQEYDPKIIAITLPPDFSVRRDEAKLYPRIPIKLRAFFDGVGIPVISGRLPFERIEGSEAHNQNMKLIVDVLSLFGGGFSVCVQAVLQACDHGVVDESEKVIGLSGDCAAVMTASTTKNFLSREHCLSINEILCKPRTLTIARGEPARAVEQNRDLFANPVLVKASTPKPRELLSSNTEIGNTVTKQVKD